MRTVLAVFVLLLLAAPTLAAEPWLEFANNNSQVYRSATVSVQEDGSVAVRTDRGQDALNVDYATKLSADELAWFRAVARAINFNHPDRRPGELLGGHQGTYTVRITEGGKTQQATFGADPSFDELRMLAFRLVRQGEVITTMQKDRLCYDALTAVRNRTVLQPAALIEPLTTYVLRDESQVDHALEALSLLVTPEAWGGLVTRAIDEAGDKALKPGSDFTRRQLLLGVIAGHPFYSNLEDTHNLTLVTILRTQAAIEQARGDKHGFVRRAASAEQELVKTAKR